MRTVIRWALCLPLVFCVGWLAGCGDDAPKSTASNNGTTNNGVTNNGVTNNGATNNGVNNGVTNNGTNNNGTTNNGEGPPDADGDGVSDADEAIAGTDPLSQDTDEDGFWDGWELNVGTDPTNPASVPEVMVPGGEPFKLTLEQIVQPEPLIPLAAGRLGSVPPILVFVSGLTDGSDDEVELTGGIGSLLNNGEDEVPGTDDDVYALRFSSFSQLTGEFLIGFEGRVQGRALAAGAEVISLDLTGISDITEGLRLRVEEVDIDATFSEDLMALSDGNLQGVLTRQGVAELADALRDILPLDPDVLLSILDPDGDDRVPVHFRFTGRQVQVDGVAARERDVAPIARSAGTCCPQGATLGASVDAFLQVRDQGIQPEEEELASRAIAALIADEDVLYVTTLRVMDGQFHYFVHSATGMVEFVRERMAGGTVYTVIHEEGVNPVGQQDLVTWSSFELLAALGQDQAVANPEGTTYVDKGYPLGDERLYFVPADQMTYPHAYERIAAYFDDPRAGDLAVEPYSWAGGGFSSHGHLGVLESRSPLIIAGPGVRNATNTGATDGFAVVDFAGDGQDPSAREFLYRVAGARQVDIAPTVAAALGVDKHELAVHDGVFSDDAYLAWQDGDPLLELFTDEAQARIAAGEPVAQRALILINDGLTSVEILHEAENAGFDVAQYRQLMERGVSMQYGSISNWPSNTYPGHNVVAAGAYSGHHGVIANNFYEREVAESFSPISDLVTTEKFYGSGHPGLPVETLYEAVHRTYGAYDPAGGVTTLTASVNDPSSRGATFATLERRRPEGMSEVSTGDAVTVGGRAFTLPEVGLEDYEGFLDNSTVWHLHDLFLGGEVALPRLVVANFASTDGGGHTWGPHGDVEREVVIPRVNDRLEIVMAILEEAGVLDETLIVLTSDHGMELKDRGRQGSIYDGLSSAGIRFVTGDNAIYFKTLAVEVEGALTAAQPATLSLTVTDSDTVGAETPLYPVGAEVMVIAGGAGEVGVVDGTGHATVTVTPAADASEVVLEIRHPSFTASEVRLPVAL